MRCVLYESFYVCNIYCVYCIYGVNLILRLYGDVKWWCGIREYGSTLYVGLARDVSPTNTNFRLTYLLTRLQVALYEDLAV